MAVYVVLIHDPESDPGIMVFADRDTAVRHAADEAHKLGYSDLSWTYPPAGSIFAAADMEGDRFTLVTEQEII
jgi:hypothetical protein